MSTLEMTKMQPNSQSLTNPTQNEKKNKIFEIWAHNTYFVSDRHNTKMKNVLWNLKMLFRQVVNTYEHFEGVKNLKFVKHLKFLFWFDLLILTLSLTAPLFIQIRQIVHLKIKFLWLQFSDFFEISDEISQRFFF